MRYFVPLGLLIFLLARPSFAQKTHYTLDVGFGFAQFQPGWGIMGAYSLMQQTPRRSGFFFESQGYGDFSRNTGSTHALGWQRSQPTGKLFTTLGAGLGYEAYQRDLDSEMGTPAARDSHLGLYGHASIGVDLNGIRLTVRTFGLATSHRPIYGFSFGLGGRF